MDLNNSSFVPSRYPPNHYGPGYHPNNHHHSYGAGRSTSRSYHRFGASVISPIAEHEPASLSGGDVGPSVGFSPPRAPPPSRPQPHLSNEMDRGPQVNEGKIGERAKLYEQAYQRSTLASTMGLNNRRGMGQKGVRNSRDVIQSNPVGVSSDAGVSGRSAAVESAARGESSSLREDELLDEASSLGDESYVTAGHRQPFGGDSEVTFDAWKDDEPREGLTGLLTDIYDGGGLNRQRW